MSKITLTNVSNTASGSTLATAINNNNTALTTAIDNTLSRDGTTPNTMGSNLDMNSYKILNLPAPTSNYEPLRLIDAELLNGNGTINVSGLPAGGTTNQVLKKNSATNYDTSWATISTTIPTGGSTGQILTKNSNSDYDASWQSPVEVNIVTPEQFGYTGSGDAGPAINAAINSTLGPVTVSLGARTYLIVTPILVTRNNVWIQGAGMGLTTLSFSPSFANQTCITYNAAPVTTGIYYGKITDLTITSGNVTLVKTAINLYDVGDMEVSNIYIYNFTDPTKGCIGLKTNGRQCSEFRSLHIFCDLPIYIGVNANAPGLCTDHFHFMDVDIISATTNACITCEANVVITNMTFDGYQAWVLGTYGFYWPSSLPQRSYNLSFNNVRSEGGSSAAAYTFYINPASGGGTLVNLSINNCTPDPTRKGLFARNILAGTLSNTYFAHSSAMEAYNIDASVTPFLVSNCRFEPASTASIGALTTKYSYTFGGITVAANALYST